MPKKNRQYANRVRIIKYVKSGDKWRFGNPVERKGKIVRDHVWIEGRDEHHPEGTYYIEWYENGSQRRKKSVPDFAQLVEQARRKAFEIEGLRNGVIEAKQTPPRQAPVVSW
ncbi:MAG TPA: hypothetical protein VFI95_14425 [Terriglobales bacterium]|nr:hypothetical protein [Terriglobales bacterium]